MIRQPYAYLRKSRVFRDKQSISPEMQLKEVTELAARFGATQPLVVLEDMNISGRKGRAKRPGFAQLLEDLEAGKVEAIYSYSLSRLSRSVRDIMDLVEACRGAGVAIHLVADADPDPTSASGRMMLGFLAVMAQFEADVASERARDTVELRRARGDRFGPPVYGKPELVRQAFEETGSYSGAARWLNDRKVPTRGEDKRWWPSSVRTIIRRAYPELAPVKAHAKAGARTTGTALLARLLRCHCGGTMTPKSWVQAGRWPYTSYFCARARGLSDHGKADISERGLLEWVKGEVALLHAPESVTAGEGLTETRNALLDRKLRVGKAYAAGALEERDFDDQMASIEAELGLLDDAGQDRAVVSEVRWDDEASEVNRVLRSILAHVQLGPDLKPVEAKWWVPEWRHAPADAEEPAPPVAVAA